MISGNTEIAGSENVDLLDRLPREVRAPVEGGLQVAGRRVEAVHLRTPVNNFE